MRKLLASRNLSVTIVALALAGALASFGACAAEEGVNPNCVQDVDGNGNQGVDNGCNPFGTCRNEKGDVLPAAECCKDAEGTPFEGPVLQICLYGYGEDVDLSTSATTGGAGGAGGGGTGGAGGGGS